MLDKPSYKTRQEGRSSALADYWPLAALILVAALAGLAATFGIAGGLQVWMHYFMGIFLCIFALLKLFNPYKFADGFQMYDLLAKRSRAYAYAYPLLELALGLGYLSFWQPALVYVATILLLTFGAVGVIRALKRGLDINCPCMGTVLAVPLSTVTLTEDIGMALMAAVMLALM